MVLSIPNNSNRSSIKNFGSISETNFIAPDLVHIQKESYDWLLNDGIKELFEEISPIDDSSGERFEVRFIDHEIREPIRSEEDCRKEEVTYSAPLQSSSERIGSLISWSMNRTSNLSPLESSIGEISSNNSFIPSFNSQS